MKRREAQILVIAILISAALILTAITVFGRGWRGHNRVNTLVERVYQNGLVFAYMFCDGECTHEGWSGKDVSVYLYRREGIQRLDILEPNVLGPENGGDLPYWLIRWKDPIYPSPPLLPGTRVLMGFHEWSDEGRGPAKYPRISDCSTYDQAPDYFISDECRIAAAAPAPYQLDVCSQGSVSGADVSKNIDFPLDVRLYDLNVSLTYSETASALTSTLITPQGREIKLLTDRQFEESEYSDTVSISLDDQGIHFPQDGPALTYTVYLPDQPINGRSAPSAQGTWTLSLETGDGSPVTLGSWCMDALVYRTVRFQQSAYSVAEGDGPAQVTAVLSEPADTATSINVIAKSPGGQEVARGGTTFAAGQSTALINIPIIDDAVQEPDEVWSLELSDPGRQYGLTDQSFAALTISDDDDGQPEATPQPTPKPPVDPAGDYVAFVPMVSRGSGSVRQAAPEISTPQRATAPYTWQELADSAVSVGISDSTSDSRWPDMVVDAYGRPYIAWSDEGPGVMQVYLKYWDGSAWRQLVDSSTGGESATGGGISDTATSSRRPALALDGEGNIYVAWEENVGNGWQIYVKRYDIASGHWEALFTSQGGVSNSSYRARFPSLAVLDKGYLRDPDIYLAYSDENGQKPAEIKVKQYDTSTGLWNELDDSQVGGGISNTLMGVSTNPQLAIGKEVLTKADPSSFEPYVYVAWQDQGDPAGDYDVYVKKYDPLSQTWTAMDGTQTSGLVADLPGNADYAQLIVETYMTENGFWDSGRNLVSLAWSQDVGGNEEIYVWQYDDDDDDWKVIKNFATAPDSKRPTITMGPEQKLYVAWEEVIGDNREIFAGEVLGQTANISNNSGSSERAIIVIAPSGVPYVTWMDDTVGDYEIYFKWYQWWSDDYNPMPLENGGFEEGAYTYWDESSKLYNEIVRSDSFLPKYRGNWIAWFQGDNENATLAQNFRLSAAAKTLSFYAWLASPESGCNYDTFTVAMAGPGGRENLFESALCDNTDTNGWQRFEIDISNFAGDEVYLYFNLANDSSNNSHVYLDDVVISD